MRAENLIKRFCRSFKCKVDRALSIYIVSARIFLTNIKRIVKLGETRDLKVGTN